jgi:hypothetical protein
MVEPRLTDEQPTEFRADPGAHWPAIITFCVLALLSLAGVVWLIIRPGPITPGRVLTALFLAVLALLFVAGARWFWLKLGRLFRLHSAGLEYFDGRQTHDIPWDQVVEVYETISSVKLLGVAVDAPQFQVALVTNDGIRCAINRDIQGSDRLAPVVSRAVNQRLSEWASRQLLRRRPVSLGCLSLSETGILIAPPAPLPWWEAVRRRFESQVGSVIVVPGEYAWENISACGSRGACTAAGCPTTRSTIRLRSTCRAGRLRSTSVRSRSVLTSRCLLKHWRRWAIPCDPPSDEPALMR